MRLVSTVVGFFLRKLGLLAALVLSLFLGYLVMQSLVPALREAAADRDRLERVVEERAALQEDLGRLQAAAAAARSEATASLEAELGDEVGTLQGAVATRGRGRAAARRPAGRLRAGAGPHRPGDAGRRVRRGRGRGAGGRRGARLPGGRPRPGRGGRGRAPRPRPQRPGEAGPAGSGRRPGVPPGRDRRAGVGARGDAERGGHPGGGAGLRHGLGRGPVGPVVEVAGRHRAHRPARPDRAARRQLLRADAGGAPTPHAGAAGRRGGGRGRRDPRQRRAAHDDRPRRRRRGAVDEVGARALGAGQGPQPTPLRLVLALHQLRRRAARDEPPGRGRGGRLGDPGQPRRPQRVPDAHRPPRPPRPRDAPQARGRRRRDAHAGDALAVGRARLRDLAGALHPLRRHRRPHRRGLRRRGGDQPRGQGDQGQPEPGHGLRLPPEPGRQPHRGLLALPARPRAPRRRRVHRPSPALRAAVRHRRGGQPGHPTFNALFSGLGKLFGF